MPFLGLPDKLLNAIGEGLVKADCILASLTVSSPRLWFRIRMIIWLLLGGKVSSIAPLLGKYKTGYPCG